MPRRRSTMIAVIGIPVALALVYAIPAAIAPGPADSPLTLEASLSDRKLTIRRDGETVKTYDIAIGAERYPTPPGSYNIHRMVWNPAWTPPNQSWAQGTTPKAPGEGANPMRTVKIFFQEPDYYIHGTNATETLGEAASHGCLRMDPDDAAEVGLLVMENGGITRDWDWVKNILGLGQEKYVTLQRDAPLTIRN